MKSYFPLAFLRSNFSLSLSLPPLPSPLFCHVGVLTGRFNIQPPLLTYFRKPPHIWAVNQPAPKSVGKQPGRYVNQKVCELGLPKGSPWKRQDNRTHSSPAALPACSHSMRVTARG